MKIACIFVGFFFGKENNYSKLAWITNQNDSGVDNTTLQTKINHKETRKPANKIHLILLLVQAWRLERTHYWSQLYMIRTFFFRSFAQMDQNRGFYCEKTEIKTGFKNKSHPKRKNKEWKKTHLLHIKNKIWSFDQSSDT